ncbi:MAG: permease-like cell division protein FtsX [bacterium]|nr:permease-like cell division protein FtsX [bacterium]
MFGPTLNRILRSGWEKFSRDTSSSSAALLVMVIVLSIVTSLFFLQGISSFLIESLQESVDVSTFLKDSAPTEEVTALQQSLSTLPEVKEVIYVSKEDALAQFIGRHEKDQVILDSLDAIGANPLLASISIKAWDPASFGKIAEFLETTPLASIIQNVDFHERAPVINRLAAIASGVRTTALAGSIFAGLIAVLVAFNTIRLTIYSSKEEIEIMRLVGASNMFIRSPFLLQGIIVGALASLLTFILLVPFTLFLSSKLETFVPQFSLFEYFMNNFFMILFLQLFVGIGLGVLSSLIAIRRYLKV